MDKFMLFAGHRYYPRGAEDYRDTCDNILALQALYDENIDKWMREQGQYTGDSWGQIVRSSDMKILLQKELDKPWHDPKNEIDFY